MLRVNYCEGAPSRASRGGWLGWGGFRRINLTVSITVETVMRSDPGDRIYTNDAIHRPYSLQYIPVDAACLHQVRRQASEVWRILI